MFKVFQNKVVLITGSSGTLGHAFAESLANAGDSDLRSLRSTVP